jgi:hypothetical protein
MGERREHPPLPGTLQVIPATSLRGMEQPVRSLRSFIRTAPLHSGPDGSKPLPPTPTSPEGPVLTVSPSPAQHPLGQSISDTVWSIPATWDDPSTLKLDFQASPFSTARSHGLLLPEPSPGITDSDEQRPWPFNLSNSQPSNLAFRAKSLLVYPLLYVLVSTNPRLRVLHYHYLARLLRICCLCRTAQKVLPKSL